MSPSVRVNSGSWVCAKVLLLLSAIILFTTLADISSASASLVISAKRKQTGALEAFNAIPCYNFFSFQSTLAKAVVISGRA